MYIKNIKWDAPITVGVLSKDDLKPIDSMPNPGDSIIAIYKGINIRLRTVDSSDKNAISAVIECADSVSDELPKDLISGAYVNISKDYISWIRFNT